ncbi:type I restriction-modification system subunit M (plasmid) [Bacillus tropicus]|uniref:HsdM family class I SAM-dependent methyltransferase n=1 Tax=Bacillus tropicus TaxID=2026188 RepID=UPI00200557B0|nr:class I SAM-dependent DNA methyltransferase [Bacillus tropicus]UOK49048.1 type I restriction-modification system subunit M [Bacillus tropicus]
MSYEKTAKKLANQLWNIANTGNKMNSINTLEHLSYLLYFRSLKELSEERVHNGYLWDRLISEIHYNNSDFLLEIYRRELLTNNELIQLNEELFENLGAIPIPFDANTFVRIVEYLEQIPQFSQDNIEDDWYAKIFEHLITKLAPHGVSDTPKFLAETIVEMIGLMDEMYKPSRICDPACGSGALLISAYKHLSNYLDSFYYSFTGYEINTSISRISQMNLIFNGVGSPIIHNFDSLSLGELEKGKYDFVLVNPPFLPSINPLSLPEWYQSIYLGDTKSKGIYHYINLTISLLSPSGRCAVIVPEGLLFGNSNKQVYFRKELLNQVCIDGIISLPNGLFSNTSMKTSLLLITKVPHHKIKDDIWFFEFDQPASNLKNSKNPWNELLEAWGKYKSSSSYDFQSEAENTWVTKVNQIEANDFNLSASQYRVRKENQTRDDIEPEEIFDQLIKIEKEIGKEMDELNKLASLKLYEENLDKSSISVTPKAQMAVAEANLGNILPIIESHLSKKQRALLNIFMSSNIPLACHEAAKVVNLGSNSEFEKINVQEAKQITNLFESLGLIEPVLSGDMHYPKQHPSEKNRVITLKDPITIVLWKKSERIGG